MSLLILSLGVLALLAWLIFIPDTPGLVKRLDVDGEGIDISLFGGDNKTKVKIIASSQKNIDDRRFYLYDFFSEFVLDGDKKEPMKINGDRALITNISNNTQNIEIEKNVKVESPSLLLTGPYLFFKEQNFLFSDKPMNFKIKNLSGKMEREFRYDMPAEVIIMMGVSGVLDLSTGMYDYKSQELALHRKASLLHLADQIQLDGGGSRLRCQILDIYFDADMKLAQKSIALNEVQFQTEPDERGTRKNTYRSNSERMDSLFGDRGQVIRTELHGQVDLTIIATKGELNAQSHSFLMDFDPETGTIAQVEMPTRGKWEYAGDRQTFSSTSDIATYYFTKKGDFIRGEAEGLIEYRLNDYNGEADKLVYSPKKETVDISGRKCWINRGGRLFHSKSIKLNTAKNELSSTDVVLSSLVIKNVPPFKSEAVMIKAGSVQMEERKNRIQYSDGVDVSQAQLRLLCKTFHFSEGEMLAQTGVLFQFVDVTDPVILKGNQLKITGSKESVIHLLGQAHLIRENTQLMADEMRILWSNMGKGRINSIQTKKNIRLTGENVDVWADTLVWTLDRDLMVFSGDVRVVKNGFESKGEEVELNTKTHQLRILRHR